MAVPVRINEDNYVSLQKEADRQRRSVIAQLNHILDNYFERSTLGIWQTSNENTLSERTLVDSVNRTKDRVTQSMPLATATLKPKVIKTPAEAKDIVSDFKSFKNNDICPHGFSKSARMCKKGCR